MDLMHRKFAGLVRALMAEHEVGNGGLAWALDCRTPTVTAWAEGERFPSRDNALKLAFLSREIGQFLNQLAKVERASLRIRDGRAYQKAG